MIEFNYRTLKDEVIVTLKTDITAIGTFHRMATVIYVLGWNIQSGEIQTIIQDGVEYALDSLNLKIENGRNVQEKAVQIGILMDSIFSQKVDLEELKNKYEFKPPQVKNFFREKAELIFQDEPKIGQTCFYIEADSGRGLLYHVTRVLLDYKINIISGSIETDGITHRAKDTFYLVDDAGKMFGETKKAEEIRQKILKPL